MALKLDPRNPRVHGERQLQQLAKSIRVFGFVQPVLIDGMLRVLAGHGRIEAAKLLGLREVPTISIKHLSENQIQAFKIADNRLAEQATWDQTLLGEQLKLLSEVELDFDLEVTGFVVPEIDLLIEGITPGAKSAVDAADLLPETTSEVPVTREGDVWLLDRNRILCGNSLDETSYVALMEHRDAAMVFTDPPYNVPITGHATGLGKIRHHNFRMASGEMSESEYTDFLARVLSLMSQHSTRGSIHFVCIDEAIIAIQAGTGRMIIWTEYGWQNYTPETT